MNPFLSRQLHRRQGLARDGLVCLLAGLMQALCAGWPDNGPKGTEAAIELQLLAEWAWLLQLLAAAMFFQVLRGRLNGPARHTAWAAGVFGLSWQAGVIWWLHIGMHKYAGLTAPLSVAAVVALSAYLAMYTVLASLLFRWSCRTLEPATALNPALRALATAAAFAAAWLLAELGRAMVMTGFPWANSGYAHLNGPLRALAPWAGVYGAGAAAAFAAALLPRVLAFHAGRRLARAAAALGLFAVGVLLAGLPDARFTQSHGEFEVVLLQGNVSQDGKFDQARISQALAWHLRELSRSRADLTLTPETAFPVLEQELPDAYWQRLRQRVQAHPGVLLIGVPHRMGTQGQSNTLLGMGHAESLLDVAAGEPYRYHKAHLVPFAEFSPPGFAWFTRMLDLPLPTFVPGTLQPQMLRIRTRSGPVQAIAPLICFEDLYGEEMALRFRDPERAPTAFANASNLAWFDDASALPQHLRIAQYRSLEFQRPTVRATNTGPTVVIDHRGQVARALAPNTVGVLAAVVEGRTGLTPYAWWVSRTGLWPLLLLALLLLAVPRWAGLVAQRRSGRWAERSVVAGP